MEEKKERVTWKRVLTLYVPLAASVIFIMFPLIWAMFTSVKTTGQIRGAEVQIFPNPIVWENYANVMAMHSAGFSLREKNSLP